MELCALEVQKISHRLIMGKCCLHASSFVFYRIIIKVAGHQDRHKSSDEFDFGPLVSMAHLYVFWNEIWPWHTGLRWAIVALWATCLMLRMITYFMKNIERQVREIRVRTIAGDLTVALSFFSFYTYCYIFSRGLWSGVHCTHRFCRMKAYK